jgi:hypothetical protein
MSKNSWLEEMREFFFLGVIRGWASGNDGYPLPEEEGGLGIEGWKETIYQDSLGFAGYRLVDRWGRDPDSGKPSGSMMITHFKMPAWVMWCGGELYEKEALPFLREALMASFRKRKFYGGRGPRRYSKGDLLYVNRFHGSFERFHGQEYIENVERNVRLGGHQYWGGSLVYLKKP